MTPPGCHSSLLSLKKEILGACARVKDDGASEGESVIGRTLKGTGRQRELVSRRRNIIS